MGLSCLPRRLLSSQCGCSSLSSSCWISSIAHCFLCIFPLVKSAPAERKEATSTWPSRCRHAKTTCDWQSHGVAAAPSHPPSMTLHICFSFSCSPLHSRPCSQLVTSTLYAMKSLFLSSSTAHTHTWSLSWLYTKKLPKSRACIPCTAIPGHHQHGKEAGQVELSSVLPVLLVRSVIASVTVLQEKEDTACERVLSNHRPAEAEQRFCMW